MKNIAQNCQLMIKTVFGMLKYTNNKQSLKKIVQKRGHIGPISGKLAIISAQKRHPNGPLFWSVNCLPLWLDMTGQEWGVALNTQVFKIQAHIFCGQMAEIFWKVT